MNKMKYIYISLLFFVGHTATSQTFDIQITEVIPATSPRTIIVEAQRSAGTEPMTTDFLLGLEFSLKYDPASGISFGAIDNTAGYGMTADASGTLGSGEEFQTFVLGSAMFFPSNWDGFTEVMRVEVVEGDAGEVVALGTTAELPSGDPAISAVIAGSNVFEEMIIGLPVVLPIDLKSFTAAKYSETAAILNWASASEVNASHYNVERSTDLTNWEFVGKVDAYGNTYNEKSYELIDTRVPLQSRSKDEVFYYRLQMVDVDGAFEYSDTEAVRFDAIATEGLVTYPNPTRGDIFVTVDGVSADGAPMYILDRSGKIVMSQRLQHGQDERVSIEEVPAGLYHMAVEVNGERLTQKIIKID